METGGLAVTRFLCFRPRFGVTAAELLLKLAERLVRVVDQTQQRFNAVLALARQRVDAEEVTAELLQKMLTMAMLPEPQPL